MSLATTRRYRVFLKFHSSGIKVRVTVVAFDHGEAMDKAGALFKDIAYCYRYDTKPERAT